MVRPIREEDAEQVVAGITSFHAGHDLVPSVSPSSLAASLATTSLGEPIRQYRVATAPDGSIVAGAGVGERFKLMTDHIDRIPAPLAVLGRVAGMIPADRTIRSVELFLAWHAPGRVDAARRVWDAIRHEWRDQVTSVVGLADPRSTLIEAFQVSRLPGPRVDLVVAVRSPVPIGSERLIYLWR